MAQLRLFGPVQLWAGDRLVDLGSPKQRTVVAALAVDLGRVVTVDTLVDRVWGEQTPADPRAVLYGYLTRTRRALEAGGGDADGLPRLLRRPAGYLLDFDPDRVDLHRFGALTSRARDPQCGEADQLGLLREALSLWRDEPLAGLAGDWAQRVRHGWSQRRIEAVTAWARAEVAAGDPGAVVGPVTELLGEDPLVEPLVLALMRALHATGRGAEALRQFAAVRERLAEELGADPSVELEQLHLSILRGDPSRPAALPAAAPAALVAASSSAAVSVAASPPAPAQLPANVPGFVGRDDPLARLDAVLARSGQPETVVICALSGTAGVGKTALAVHWAHQVADRFPDGQLYVNLRGFDPGGAATDPAEAVRGLLDALGVAPQQAPTNLAAQTGLYRSLLAGKHMLIVLDNARDAEQVRPLLPGSPGCLVVVTSRNHLAGLVAAEAAHPVVLGLLSPAEARELLANRLGADRVAAEPDAADEIIARCARLPLALAVVAARAAAHPDFPLRALAGELRHALDSLTVGDAATDVRAAFSWSYQLLDAEAARLFRLLGLHPGPDVAAPAAASLAGVPADRAGRLLAELARAQLVTEHPAGRYDCHDLLRAYAAELARRDDSEADRQAAIGRMLDHYLHTTHAADRLLNPHRDAIGPTPYQQPVPSPLVADDQQALAWFTAEHRVLLAVTRLAADSGFDVHAWQLAWTSLPLLDRFGRWHELAATHAAALAAARRLGDRAAQAQIHRGTARVLTRLGRYDDADAHLRQALDRYRDLGDELGLAHTQLSCGIVLERQGRYRQALREAGSALDRYRSAGHKGGQARALNNVGWLHNVLGEHRSALRYCRQALAVHQATGNRQSEAVAWDSIGFAHQHLGHHQEAIDCYQRAIDLFGAAGDRVEQAATLVHLGEAHAAAGGHGAAGHAWRRAVDILAELGHPDTDQVRAKLRQLGQPLSG